MNLATVIEALRSARGAIVSEINSKGVEVSESATLYDCAAAIRDISQGGGGATDFYKCASVTSGGSTWTGYKAVLNNQGYYEFESNSTEELQYTSIIPSAGNIYTPDALVRVAYLWNGIPTDYIFYAPLDSTASSDVTGHSMSRSGNLAVQSSFHGIPCTQFNPGYVYLNQFSGFPTGNNPWSVTIWAYPTAIDTTYNVSIAIMFGQWSGDKHALGLNFDPSGFSISTVASGLSVVSGSQLNSWHFVAATFDGATLTGYCDGQSASKTDILNLDSNYIIIGDNYPGNGATHFYGYLAAARIYNRALSNTEIEALSKEFKPA